jgi:hypothetical protein
MSYKKGTKDTAIITPRTGAITTGAKTARKARLGQLAVLHAEEPAASRGYHGQAAAACCCRPQAAVAVMARYRV